jgi:hypothetical protein
LEILKKIALDARLADVHVSTLVRLEGAGWRPIPGTMTTINRVLDVLENVALNLLRMGCG